MFENWRRMRIARKQCEIRARKEYLSGQARNYSSLAGNVPAGSKKYDSYQKQAYIFRNAANRQQYFSDQILTTKSETEARRQIYESEKSAKEALREMNRRFGFRLGQAWLMKRETRKMLRNLEKHRIDEDRCSAWMGMVTGDIDSYYGFEPEVDRAPQYIPTAVPAYNVIPAVSIPVMQAYQQPQAVRAPQALYI